LKEGIKMFLGIGLIAAGVSGVIYSVAQIVNISSQFLQ